MKNSEDELIRSLKDAGCTNVTISGFIENYRRSNIQAALNFIEKRRQTLLDKVHDNEKKISCLDYLIYEVEKEQNKER